MSVIENIKLIGIILFLSVSMSYAQLSQEIDSITIATTRLPLKLKETGRNISVIKGSDLQNIAFTSLDELLQYIPGIEVQSRNAFGVQGDITMRGSTFTQVLVLVNGMKLNDPLTGHFNSYMPVATSEISRIEVLRGAASAIYGADAVGGVINIITHGFEGNNLGEDQVSLGASYGEHGLIRTQVGLTKRGDNSFISIGAEYNNANGENIPAQSVNGTELEAYDNFFDIKTIGLSGGVNLDSGWNLRSRLSYDHRDFSARYFYTSSTFDKSVETTSNIFGQLKLSKINANNSTDFQLAYRRGTDVFVFSPDFPSTNEHTTDFYNFNANHFKVLSNNLSIKIGAQADYRNIESTDRGDHNDNHFGVYLIADWRPINGLNVNYSARIDNDQNYGTEFSPQANLAYQAGSITFRASAGKSIRAADYTERYVSFLLQDLTPGRSLGNPDLLAEESWSQEIGADISLGKTILWKSTLFFRQSDNLVDYVSTNEVDIPNNSNLIPGENYFYARNIANTNTTGFETEFWLNKAISDQTRISGSIGYTYLNTSNEEEVISVYISSHANHLLTTNLLLEANKFRISLNGLYKQRDARNAQAINANLESNYMLWNTKIQYELTGKLSGNLQIHNLFDEEYQDILGAPMPGRWILAGFNYTL